MNGDELTSLVQQDRTELMLRVLFFSRILCSCDFVFIRDPRVRIACTDGRNIFLSADTYPDMPEEHRLAILAHEVMHIALRHMFRIGNRTHDRFNVAADIEIHFRLRDSFQEPYTIECDEDWADLIAEQIYDLLPEEPPKPQSDHCCPGDELQQSQDGADSMSQAQQDNTDAGQTEEGISQFRPQFDSESEMDCRMLSAGTMQDKKRLKGHDSVSDSLDRLMDKLSKPHLNWRVLLRQFVQSCRGGSYSWLPPNRRFIAKGLYLPGRRDHQFRGVVALDTSGSTIDILSEFVTELTGLLRTFGKFELTMIECDSVIHQVWKVSSSDPLPDLTKHTFKGGGGTDFTPVFEYVGKHIPNPNVLIFFTDGYGTCPDAQPSYPVLWMLTEDGEIPVKWGYEIHYKEV